MIQCVTSDSPSNSNEIVLELQSYRPLYIPFLFVLVTVTHDSDSLYLWRFRDSESSYKSYKITPPEVRLIVLGFAWFFLKIYKDHFISLRPLRLRAQDVIEVSVT